MLATISVNTIFSVFVIFSRIGSACMLLPGIGETYITTTWKVIFGVILSIIIYNTIFIPIPTIQQSSVALLLLLAHEVIIGICIGLMSKVIFSVLHTAGMIISLQSGLSAAIMFNNLQETQGSIVGTFLHITALVMFLVTNLHLEVIKVLITSYDLISLGGFGIIQDNFIESFIRIMSSVWSMSIRLSIPFIISGLIIFIAMGILSRLMPQLQMFFLILPAQILLFIFIFCIVISGMISWFLEQYKEILGYALGAL